MGRAGARPGDEVGGGPVRPRSRGVRTGLCGGKAGRLPPPCGPYRSKIYCGSRGAVGGDLHALLGRVVNGKAAKIAFWSI